MLRKTSRKSGAQTGDPWSRNDRLQLIAVVVAVLTLVVGTVVAVVVPEIRCSLHLDRCAAASNPSPANSEPAALSTLYAVAPLDPNLPFGVDSPPPHAVSADYPSVRLSLESILNRGKPVTFGVIGANFFANSLVEIDWYTPQGSTYAAPKVATDDRGIFSYAFRWEPLPSLTIAGNNGPWKMSIKDLSSGTVLTAQMNVTSDDQTPHPSLWADLAAGSRKPSANAEANASTSGVLCKGSGAQTVLRISGFAPEANVAVFYLRAAGKKVIETSVLVDGSGSGINTQYWMTQNCGSQVDFTYTVVLVDTENRRSVQTGLVLPTLSN